MISVGRVLWALLKTISSVKFYEFRCPLQEVKGKAIYNYPRSCIVSHSQGYF